MSATPLPCPSGMDPKEWEALDPAQQALANRFYGKGASKYESQVRELEQREKAALERATSLEGASQLTESELQAARTRLKELEEKYMSEEDRLKRSYEEKLKERDTKLTQTEQIAQQWRKSHLDSMIERELAAAAAKGEAFKVEQVVDMLRGRVKVEEVPGQNGSLPTFKLTLPGKDKDGNPIDVKIEDAMEAFFTENPNLCKGKVIAGRDGSFSGLNTPTGQVITAADLDDPEFAQDPKNWEKLKAAMSGSAQS